jgi:hypothetical protein
MVTEASWIEFVFPVKPPVGSERKAEPTGAMITKEMVPDSFIDSLQEAASYREYFLCLLQVPQDARHYSSHYSSLELLGGPA